MAPIAHGDDGGGSIRIPASNCNLFGLKPQRGRVSFSPLAEQWLGLSAAGCVSRTVIDTALFLDVVRGGAPGDKAAAADRPRPLVEARVPPRASCGSQARPRRSCPTPKADECVAAYEETTALLRSLGHEVSEAAPNYGPLITDFYPLYFRGIRDEAAGSAAPRAALRPDQGLRSHRPRVQ